MKDESRKKYAELFAFNGKDNILDEKDFGIVNGSITAGIQYSAVVCVSGLWAPPFASSDFLLELTLFGEKIETSEYEWLPFAVTSKGKTQGLEVAASTVLIPGKRAFIIEVSLENSTPGDITVPVAIAAAGGMDAVEKWDFQRPQGDSAMDLSVDKSVLMKTNKNLCMITGTDLGEVAWDTSVSRWQTETIIPVDGKKVFYIVTALGEKDSAFEDYQKIASEPKKAINSAQEEFERRAAGMFQKLPVFEAADKRLTSFYYRSLVHYLTNRWQVPAFALNPFYSTGSIKGGCLLSYLWDFSEGWELHPLFDAPAIKEHIKQYLKIDITSCFSFDPITGGAVGPWYPVNQEKIIGLIYYYVLHTGDTAFLNDNVNGKTVLDWVLYHATFWDRENGEAELYDYGMEGEHHLELRRGYPYNGEMPDLNARRYQNYLRAYQLAELAGRKEPYLLERAQRVKLLLKEVLWNKREKWFDFISAGKRDTRYTMQMFKLIGSGVLDDEELSGLLSHLNEEEFLSPFGLHSLSKKDPAYDPADIDNGGPGSCSVFPPQIIERLYQAGLPDIAEDILERILWWGTKVPYWGDSFTADRIGYRGDTPLQCTIGGVAGAQMIIFGMFGVSNMPAGNIRFKPSPPSFYGDISLKGLKMKGKSFDIAVIGGKKVTVSTGSLTRSFDAGEACEYLFDSGNFVLNDNTRI